MIIPTPRRIARSRKGNVRDEPKLVFANEKEKCKEPLLRIFAIETRRDSITVTQKQFNTLALFSPTWYVATFIT